MDQCESYVVTLAPNKGNLKPLLPTASADAAAQPSSAKPSGSPAQGQRQGRTEKSQQANSDSSMTRPTLSCPICAFTNPLEADKCSTCGWPFGNSYSKEHSRDSSDGRKHSRDSSDDDGKDGNTKKQKPAQ